MSRRAAIAGLVALWFLLGCTTAPAPAPVASQSLQIYIAETGFYRLTRTALANAGLAAAGLNPAHLHLFHRSTEIPLDIRDSSGDFSLYFYAAPTLGTYSSTDAYLLSLDASDGARIPSRPVAPVRTDSSAASFSTVLNLEENKIYSANAFEGNHWFWQALTAPVTRTFTVTLSAPASASAEVALKLAGGTEGGHALDVLLNGVQAGTARWEGQTAFTATVRAGNLRAGDNALTLRMPGADAAPDVLYLDSLSIAYQREFVAAANSLAFEGGAESIVLRGFSGGAPDIYDVTDAEHPQRLSGVQPAANDASSAGFYDSQPARRYVAFTPAGARAPVLLRPVTPNSLRTAPQQADYLIIAPAQFSDALKRLAAYHTAHGLLTRIIDIDQVYDAFSNGVADPHAIRAFLRYARESWPKPSPRFVLLAGKASYDYHDYLQGPNKNLVPTFLLPTPHLGEAASDDWFVATSDADIRPQLALGRIPAKSVDQLNVAIDKILAFEALPQGADWGRRTVFVADDKADSFAASADTLAARLPAGMTAQKIYLATYAGDVVAARAPLLRQWSDGAGLITYVGHGSIDTWAAGPLFGSEFLGDIRNGGRLPVLLTPTCLDGFFYHPQKDSLAEGLLFKPDGGMIAGLVPTGLSLPEAQDQLTGELFAQLFEKNAPTLGEAVMRAKQQMPIDNESMREVLSTFEVMGDPALANPFRQP